MLKKLKRIGAAIALAGMGTMALLFVTVLPVSADTETPLTPLVITLADKMIHNTSDRTGEKRTKGLDLTESFPKTLY